MAFANWWRKRAQQPAERSTRRPPRKRSFFPAVTELEERCLLTAFSYPDFSSTAGLTINPVATVVSGDILRLTNAPTPQVAEAGSAWDNSQIVLTDDFSSQFQLSMHSTTTAKPADGICFVIQNDARGVKATSTGGSLGFSGITHSLAVAFDIYNDGAKDDNNANHVSIDLDGHISDGTADSLIDVTVPSFTMYGTPFNVWVNYSASGQLLTVYMSRSATQPASPIISYSIDLATSIGGPTAYMGFTSSTGGSNADQDINSWTATVTTFSLAFTTQPADTVAGATMSPVVVSDIDSNGQPVPGAIVTLSISSGTLSGTLTATTDASGNATFSNLSDTKEGTYTLNAISGLTSTTSNPFNITAAAPSKLTYVTQPNNTTAGATLNAVTLQLVDKYGNDVPNTNVAIAASPGALSTGTSPIMTDAAGQAVFSDLSEDIVGTYTLQATVVGLATVKSNSFKITNGALATLVYLTQPNSTTAGSILNAVTVEAEDAFGNPIAAVSVGISISPGVLTTGTTPLISNAAGKVVFSNLSENTAGTYNLEAAAAGVATVPSNAFVISALISTDTLSFITQPTSTTAGVVINPVTVEIKDQFGNPVANTAISASIAPGALSSGTTPLTSNAAGQVVFSDLVEDVAGTFTLIASSAGLPSITSGFVVVSSATASLLSFVTQPNNVTAGTVLNPVTVQVTDQFGNAVSGISVGIGIAPGTLSTGTTPLISNAAGQVVFNNLSEDTAGTYSLTASSAGLTSVSSLLFVITANPTTEALSFVTQPLSTTADFYLNDVIVAVTDQYGNPIANTAINISISPGSLSTGTTPLTTDATGEVDFSDLSESVVGTYSLTATSVGLASVTSNPFVITAGVPSVLFILTEPSDTTAGTVLSATTVEVMDSWGNVVPGVAISISISPGTLSAGTTLATTDVNGNAVFSNLVEDIVGTYTLTATDAVDDLTAETDPFNITAAAPAQIVYLSQPSSTTAGAVLNPVTVQAQDQFGNVVPSVVINLAIAPGSFSTGTTPLTTDATGDVVFNDLSEDTAGTYTLTASAAAVTSISSQSFVISAQFSSATLSFVTQPSSTTAGTILNAVTVQIADQYGNPFSGLSIGIAIAPGTLSGGTTVLTSNAAGQVSFTTLVEDKTGTYTLTASASGVPSASSSSFVISAAAAATLTYLSQPSSTTAGSFVNPVTVQATDKFGNVVPGISIGIATSSGSLSTGTTPLISSAAGLVVFSDLSEDKIGTYTLVASTSGVANALSNSFVITAAAAAHLSFLTQPTSTVAGSLLGLVSLLITDTFNNPVSGALVSVSLSANALSGTTAVVSNPLGVALFGTLSVDTVGTYTITGSAAGPLSASSNAFTISAGAAATLSYVTQPSSTTAGSILNPVTVQVADKFGNAVANTAVSISLSGGTLSAGTTPLISNGSGQVVFGNLVEDIVGTYKLLASSTSLSSILSNSFTITAGTVVSFVFVSQPSNAVAGAIINPVTVKAVDQFGNAEPGITVSIGISSGSLSTGATPLTTATSGLVVFSNLSEDTTGTYTLLASAPSATTASSNLFVISPAVATGILTFVTQPTSTSAGSVLNPVTVQLADKFGNVEPNVAISIMCLPHTLSTGTTPLTTSAAGQVAFGDLSQDLAGTFSLVASSLGLASVTSNPFTITASLATAHLTYLSQPSSTQAGATLNPVTVLIADKFGNTLSGVSIGIGLTAGTLSSGTTPLLSGSTGQVVFNDLKENTVGTYTLLASSAGLTSVNSSPFTISAGAAASLSYLSQPTSTTAGSVLNPVTVQVADKFGNVVSGVAVSIGIAPGALTTGTTPIVSNGTGQAVFSNLSENTIGTFSLTASATSLTSVVSSPFTISAAGTVLLSFVTQPSSTTAGSIIKPVTVKVADKFGNAVTGVSISIATTTGSLSAGTTPLSSNSAGLVVFNDLVEDTAGTYTLAASATGLTSVNSSAFVISATTASKLAFVNQPSSTSAGATLNPLTVRAIDQYGNPVGGVPITLTLPSGTLTGTTSVSTGGTGTSVYGNLVVTSAGSFTFTASAPGLTSVSSNSFTVTAGAVAKLSYVTQPSSTTAGSIIGPVTLLVADKYGNGVPNVAVGIAAVGSTLSTGTTPITSNPQGQAVFGNLTEDTVGTYTLSASSAGLANVLSSPFSITAGAAAGITFLTQPSSGAAGSSLNAVTVKVVDQFGNIVTSGSVTIGISAGGSLNGPSSATINSLGQAVFSGLSVPTGGTFTLTANDGSASASSSPFSEATGTSILSFVTEPTATTAGGTLNPITVMLTNASGVPLANMPITIGISPGSLGGILTGTTNSLGQATFSNLTEASSGTFSLIASSTGVPSATSNSFAVTSAAAGKLVFVTQPSTTIAGNIINTVTVQAFDGSGNVLAGATLTVNIAIGTLTGTTTATTNASGLAVFSGLSTTMAGNQGLTATTGKVSAPSNSFTVQAAAPVAVSFLSQPNNTVAGSILNPITSMVVDKYGNGVPNIAVGLFIYTQNTVNGNTTLTTNSSGQAVFTGMHVNKAGVNDLTLQVSGLPKAVSNNFTVTPQMSSAKLSFVTEPLSTTANSTLNAVTVQIIDQFGNVVPNVSVSIKISTGTLSGTVSGITNSLGQLTFNKLTVSTKGNGLTLTASAPGLTSVTSNAFNIS